MPLAPDRYFSAEPAQRGVALELYTAVAGLPLICPHGHVDARLFVDPGMRFGSPVELLILPDHYVLRMLYSQGHDLEELGVPRLDLTARDPRVKFDPRRIWRRFAENFHLFNGTPTGTWLRDELAGVFGIEAKLDAATADDAYDRIAAQLAKPEFSPRRLYERFNIELLCTTDAAIDRLDTHAAIRASGWKGRVLPTFRPDAVLDLAAPGWRQAIDALSEASGRGVHDYDTYLAALEERRAFFKSMGATATDHAAQSAYTTTLSNAEANAVFQRALRGEASADDAVEFMGHMLVEMARMSAEDGLVMQLHAGALRNHNAEHLRRFGPNSGADIPVAVEFTRALRPLLERFGRDPRLRLILFTLDETTYSRELAPLAGFYPAVRLGPPWWFFDSWNGMARYFDQVIETAGLYNTAGFNDDTRALPSIPARHDLWRRAAANWLAGLVVRAVIDLEDAHAMMLAMARGLARDAYRLPETG